SIGGDNPIGALRLSLDGESPTGGGRISQFSDLARVLSPSSGDQGLIVDGELTLFENFRNISAADIFAALQLLVDQLRAAGRGGAFDRTLPLVNRSVADLIDLGAVWTDAIGSPDSPD